MSDEAHMEKELALLQKDMEYLREDFDEIKKDLGERMKSLSRGVWVGASTLLMFILGIAGLIVKG